MYFLYPKFLVINLFIIFAIFLGPIGFLEDPEKPKPGKEGAITSNASSFLPPYFSG